MADSNEMAPLMKMMADSNEVADRVTLFIKNLQPTYKQHLRFTPFENFATNKNIGMLVEDELAREMPKNATSN